MKISNSFFDVPKDDIDSSTVATGLSLLITDYWATISPHHANVTLWLKYILDPSDDRHVGLDDLSMLSKAVASMSDTVYRPQILSAIQLYTPIALMERASEIVSEDSEFSNLVFENDDGRECTPDNADEIARNALVVALGETAAITPGSVIATALNQVDIRDLIRDNERRISKEDHDQDSWKDRLMEARDAEAESGKFIDDLFDRG